MVAGGDLPLAVRWLSSGAAAVMGWKDSGALRVGVGADVVVFDAEKEWVFTPQESRSKSKNSPFMGKRLCGRARHTIVGGRLVHSI